MNIDYVCGMTVDPNSAATTYEYHGQTYNFCSPGCEAAFEKDPEKYLKPYHDNSDHGHHNDH